MALRLRTMGDIRRFLASLINLVRSGEMPAEQASKLTYIANVLIKAAHLCWEQDRMTEIEERISKLESQSQLSED